MRICVVIGSLFSGCGERAVTTPSISEPDLILPDATELGACPYKNGNGTFVDFVPFSEYFHPESLEWFLTPMVRRSKQASSATTTPQDRSIPAELLDAIPVEGGQGADATDSNPEPVLVRLYGPSEKYLSRASKRKYELLVGIDPRSRRITFAVASDTTGRIAFVGECAIRSTRSFAGYLGWLRRNGTLGEKTPRQVVTGIAGDQAGERSRFQDWLRSLIPPEPVAWMDRPADQRQIDPGEMPEELQRQLRGLQIHFGFPSEWRDHDEVTLCTKTPLAWGDCTSMDAYPEDRPTSLTARVRTGEAVEIWFLREASFSQPVAHLFTIPTETVEAALTTRSKELTLVPAGGVENIDELIAAAQRDGQALQLK